MTPAETLTLAAYFFVLIILAVYAVRAVGGMDA